MRVRWQRVRPLVWLLIPVVGVMLLFLSPWLMRELRPLSSDALFQEARAELGGARARYAHAAAYYVRALALTGDIDRAQAFVRSLPPDAKPCAQHELIRALIDSGELNRAFQLAREHLQLGDYQHCWSSCNGAREGLYRYLADELIVAGRLEDALRVLGWIGDPRGSTEIIRLYRRFVRRAAEMGRVDLALQALEQITAYNPRAETLLVVQALLQQGQSPRALDLLSRQIRQARGKDDATRLPPALEAAAQQAAQLARAGRTDAAAQLAEQTLQRYLRTHTQKTVSYDRLYTLAVRFTEHLPAATMERIIRRLPTDDYECAATNLRGGYITGLLNAGRWSDLVRALETPSGHTELPHIPREWLIVAGYLQAGKVEQAQAWLQSASLLDEKRAVQHSLQSLKQQITSLTPEVMDATKRLATTQLLGLSFLPGDGVVIGSVQDAFAVEVDITVFSIVEAGMHRHFGDAVTLTAWSMREGAERTLNGSLIYEAAFCLGLDHPQLDTLLRISDPNDTVYWMKGLAAVAQAGRLEDAEAILRAAPSVPQYDTEAYRAGYAVGLAKRGRFREAVRMARRLPYAEYRVYALSNIAVELKKRRGM
jgi:tetratricopeptide (TPR) repeat protein